MTTQTSGHLSVKFSSTDKYPTTVHLNWYKSNETSSYSTLTYSVEVTGGCNTTQAINVGYYVQINGTTVYDTGSSGTTKVSTTNGIKKTSTINISHTEAKTFAVKIYTVNNSGIVTQNTKNFTLPKLYVASNSTRLKIDVVADASVNKLPYSTTKTINGVTWTVNSNGSVTVTGTATATSDYYLHGSWNHWQKKIHCEGKHYIHLTNTGANTAHVVHMCLIERGTQVIDDIFENKIIDMGTETDLTGVFLRVDAGNTANITVYPMITQNEVAEPYVKYNEGTPVKSLLPWTNYANLATLSQTRSDDFFDYVDGTYKILYQYERNYTTQQVREIRHEDVIPPEVKLTDNSKMLSCTTSSDTIPFKIDVDVFAGTQASEAFYSMDYGQTWINIPLTSSNRAHKTFVKNINLTWLDEIYIKVHGLNPVDEKEEVYIHEMPSNYKLWLNMSAPLRSSTKNLYDQGNSKSAIFTENVQKGIPREFYYGYNELNGVWTFHGIPTEDIVIEYSPRNTVSVTNDVNDYTLSIQYISGDVTTNNGSYSIKFKNTIADISAPIAKQTYTKVIHLTPTSDPDGNWDKKIDLQNKQYIYIKKETEFDNFKIGIQLEAGSAVTSLDHFGLPAGFTRRAFMSRNNTNKKIRRIYKK